MKLKDEIGLQEGLLIVLGIAADVIAREKTKLLLVDDGSESMEAKHAQLRRLHGIVEQATQDVEKEFEDGDRVRPVRQADF